MGMLLLWVNVSERRGDRDAAASNDGSGLLQSPHRINSTPAKGIRLKRTGTNYWGHNFTGTWSSNNSNNSNSSSSIQEIPNFI
ncbi:hypothetical protein E2C01_062993 [Portunus trituberculatus]|uniref:Uncharacterized protein n=1 Tax=Portunus trituberculatus TaxID=210409 RepID=A0A5B7HF72_PORTR|nr:hypothetical protein [Portunus trituberculatus]